MITRLLFVAALLWAGVACADGGDYSSADLKITDPATLATPLGVMSAAVYAVIDNPALEADELTGVSSPWAQDAGFSGTTFEGGKAQNFPVNSVTIMPGSTTVLGPSGSHIKLDRLKRLLHAGDEIPLTLTFTKAGTRDFKAKVLSGTDFVKLYPLETTVFTLKKLQAEQAGRMIPQGLGD